MQAHFSRLMRDRSGNFGIMTAIMLPVLLGVAGMAMDVTHALDEKNRMQGFADAATLAAASAMADKGTMTAQEAEALAMNAYITQSTAADADETAEQKAAKAAKEAELRKDTQFAATTTTSSHTAASYDVRMTSSYNIPMNGLSAVLGFKTLRVTIESKAASAREGNALSMYLALDESGSMAWDTSTVDPLNPTKQEPYNCNPNWWEICYRTVPNYISKMASLKAAAAVMFGELDKADPQGELIRVGADSYDDKTKKEQSIQWGTSYVKTYVNKLPEPPDGGTDASGAIANAFNALKKANATEKTAHDGKKNTSFERFIVLMTDGEMTGNSASWNKTLDEKVRGICDQAKADKDAGGNPIKIYSIAFMAPQKGKELLEYCSSGKDDYYYEPNNMTQLVQSFGEIARKAAKTGTRLTN
ncbi:TadE/TadG family type IV pilus assembly protein [Rhizobium terrae]|uniref:TadE/TadG family type IV pilus assembly protein n=1 Tax=Rhizobium terrae TaxID=2171756 RepID=UPI000E3B9C18|nr:TadE/TadG family type IV pilus assembly protein [Rhizobium terrae]